MKSGLRGGKPRDMATFRKGGMKPKVSKEIEMPLPGGASMEMEMPMRKMSHGGMTSRGAGAAQRGYDYNIYKKGGKVKKYEDGGEVDREVRRPAFAKEMLPTRPAMQQRRMARRAPPPAPPRPSDTDVMKGIVQDMAREERVRKAEMPSEYYRKGGGVKMAGGGSCRGMGAATRGGKYSIK